MVSTARLVCLIWMPGLQSILQHNILKLGSFVSSYFCWCISTELKDTVKQSFYYCKSQSIECLPFQFSLIYFGSQDPFFYMYTQEDVELSMFSSFTEINLATHLFYLLSRSLSSFQSMGWCSIGYAGRRSRWWGSWCWESVPLESLSMSWRTTSVPSHSDSSGVRPIPSLPMWVLLEY